MAYHQKVAILQALVDLGCLPPQESTSELLASELSLQNKESRSLSNDSTSRESHSRESASPTAVEANTKTNTAKYFVGPTDQIDKRVYQVSTSSFCLLIILIDVLGAIQAQLSLLH